MSIELSTKQKEEAVTSIQDYSENHLDEKLGNIAAGALLDFFVEEIGPAIYNKAIKDVQERLSSRLRELDLEMHQEEYAYSRRHSRRSTLG